MKGINPPPEAAANGAAEALDAYLSALQLGPAPDRAALLAQFPELASHLECVEELHRLMPTEPDGQATIAGPSPAAGGAALGEFGEYLLEVELGRGGMGVVYRARQRSLNRPVALKMILTGTFASDETPQRFRAEAGAAACLQHPHVVPLFQVGEVNGSRSWR